MGAEEKARLGAQVNAQGMYNPGKGEQDIGSLMQVFNSLDDAGRGNFTNAMGQYNPQLAAAMQIAGRAQMGKDAYDQWYSGVQGRQGSNIMDTKGLPSWLTAALK